MYVVTVLFEVRADCVEAFHTAVLAQAENSVNREPGCHVFDVAVSDDSAAFYLYELYDDEAAFQLHLKTEHFLDFDAKVQPMLEAKTVKTFSLLARNPA